MLNSIKQNLKRLTHLEFLKLIFTVLVLQIFISENLFDNNSDSKCKLK